MSLIPVKKIKKAGYPLPAMVLLVVAVLILAVFTYYLPGFFNNSLNPSEEIRLYYEGELSDATALLQDDKLYISFAFIQEKFDEGLQWDEENEVIIITTEDSLYHFPLGIDEGLLNLKPYTFTCPAVQEEGQVFMPVDSLREIYNLEVSYNPETRLVLFCDLTQPALEGRVKKAGKLRTAPSIRSTWTASIAKEETVRIVKEEKGWYWVETEGLQIGYLEKGKVELTGISGGDLSQEVYRPWNPVGSPIMMTWEYVGQKTAQPDVLGELEGVQVLSPTWFHLREEGLVINRADKAFVEWAHRRGDQVWALFDNGFDPEMTHEVLHDTDLRIKVYKQLLTYADLYLLDGINIDFENMYLKDKEAFVRFIKELAPLLHEKEITLTVDVTFHSNSETWSRCYDRKALSQAADYLIVMGYDEHGASSPSAGSVSSLPWVKRGLQEMLKEVPAEKLLLGVPFYTRLWIEETKPSGEKELTVKTMTMERAREWISQRQLTVSEDVATGQHYVELEEGDKVYKMWLEDEYSLKKRVELIKKYNLAGLAAWRRGFETDETWPFLNTLVNKRW